jgi:tRNA modification GTPase
LYLLKSELTAKASEILPPTDRAALNRRQISELRNAAEALAARSANDLLIVAETIRQALAALDRLLGRQSTEDVLDELFGRFCLGK